MSYRRPMSAHQVWPLVLGLLGGCLTQSSTGDDYYGGGGGGGAGWTGGGGGGGGYGCHADTDCGSTNVCARDGECLPANEVRVIHVNWTLEQQPASAAACSTAPVLELSFTDKYGGSTFGYAPLACAQGKFTIDKMPTAYTNVAIGPTSTYGSSVAGAFDATGSVQLDLPY